MSILLHVMIALTWIVLFRHDASKQEQERLVWMEIEPRTRTSARKDESRRIVQTEQGRKIEKALPDAHLGAQNQVVDRQTVSRNKATGTASRPRSASPKVAAQHPAGKPSGALSRFGVSLPKAQSAPSDQRLPDRADWSPEMSGVPQDYIQGMNESDRTALNTKEYTFYGYYQRIRERLDLAWMKQLRHQLHKYQRSGRQLAAETDYTTRLIVTLNTRGEIVRVQIVEESGTRDLDQAAIEAFNHAGPFPNPPKGIADATGKIEIRWNFVLRS